MTIEELIKEVLKNGISIWSVTYNKEKDALVYSVNGFSKSGTADLYEEDGKIICKTRYNQIDEIQTFEDLVNVAYEWNSAYCNREPFGWDADWSPVFEKYGLLRKVTHTETTYERTR